MQESPDWRRSQALGCSSQAISSLCPCQGCLWYPGSQPVAFSVSLRKSGSMPTCTGLLAQNMISDHIVASEKLAAENFSKHNPCMWFLQKVEETKFSATVAMETRLWTREIWSPTDAPRNVPLWELPWPLGAAGSQQLAAGQSPLMLSSLDQKKLPFYAILCHSAMPPGAHRHGQTNPECNSCWLAEANTFARYGLLTLFGHALTAVSWHTR